MSRKRKSKDELDEVLTDEQPGKVHTLTIDTEKLAKLADAFKSKERKTIEVTGADLVDQMFCNYKYKHTVGPNTVNSVSTKSELPVHSDLVLAFRKLDPHLAVICEEVAPSAIKSIEFIPAIDPVSDIIRKFLVTSFRLDGTDDNMKVVLAGTKALSSGEVIKLETPKVALDASYPFATELTSTIQDLVSEVEQYMKGKKADEPQQELPFGEESFGEEDL